MICEETKSANDEIQPQEFFDKEIQENILRGENLIGRSKKTILTIVLADMFIFVMGIATLGSDSNFLTYPFLVAYPLLSLLIFFMLFTTISIYCKWLYHILSNLRKFKETRFLPKEAVVGSLFPGIGQFMTFFIFKDILSCQKEVLDSHGIKSAPISTFTLLTPLLPVPIIFLFLLLLLGIIKDISFWAVLILTGFFFPIVRYVFIFKVAFDIFAIIALLIYMNLIQHPLSNEKAIAQLNIGGTPTDVPDDQQRSA